ncbi:hypothetical protein BGW38_006417 [Lunasporangiospora selenospora]|uniref:Uncharacterized protein n=1 Tax=Lunasporangiospora selenospora TaxID=979761 RepID=A0A9P6G4X5_9FUNG|nr:hypothetical protein BGW38_006417 [Lunasporangiospora selenospora]
MSNNSTTNTPASAFRNDSHAHTLRHHGSPTTPANANPASQQSIGNPPRAMNTSTISPVSGSPAVSAASSPAPHNLPHSQPQLQHQVVLEPAAEENMEQVLMASFRTAAASVTQLYKDSLKHQRACHAKGYETALQDLLAFISGHPSVQEKKDRGLSEDEIRQTTSLSVDDIVGFIREAQSSYRSRHGVDISQAMPIQPQPQQTQQVHSQPQLAQQPQPGQHQHQQHHQDQLHHHQQQQHLIQQQQQQQQQYLQQQHQQEQQQRQQQLSHGMLQASAGAPGMPPPPATTSNTLFPSEAFTFTAPIFHPHMDQAVLQGLFPNSGPEGGIGHQMSVDSLKRRLVHDYNPTAAAAAAAAAGAAVRLSGANATRNSSPMNIDGFTFLDQQPPFKRNRRRDDL